MNISDYEFVDPAGSPLGLKEKKLDRERPDLMNRLIGALEEFARGDTVSADRLARSADGLIEVYMVPPRFVLAHLPDGAVLVRVDHRYRKLELVTIVDEYGGFDEAAQSRQIEEMARHAISDE